jgi:hypothetical protein
VTTRRARLGRLVSTAVALTAIACSLTSASLQAEAASPTDPGTWAVTNCPGYNPIHVATLPSGKLLAVAGSGYNRDTFDANTANPALKLYKAWLYDPMSGDCPAEIPLPQEHDLFCAGMTSLPDGRILMFGGTSQYGSPTSHLGTPDYYGGIKEAWAFDETTLSFNQVPDMRVARWYPQGPVDALGRPVVYSGLDENAAFTAVVERFDPASNTWTQLPSTARALPMYAGTVLRADGTFVYTGTYFGSANGHGPKVLNPLTGGYGQGVTGLSAPNCRDQGQTLRIDNRVYVAGGGCPGSATSAVSVMDLSASTLAYSGAPGLGYAAQHLVGVVLPDRSVFISGGSVGNITPRFEARRLADGAASWQTLAAPIVPRQYHSTGVVTIDGRVVTMGTNYQNGTVENRIETYTPWYAQPDVRRPAILTVSADAVIQGGSLTGTYDYASISRFTLTRLPTSTHSSDPSQLTWTVPNGWASFGQFHISIPANGNLVHAGKYYLSGLDWRGVPTVSKVITVAAGTTPACCCC